jgi:sucrose-6-phosphate hydrolase SacC (GH32 family)
MRQNLLIGPICVLFSAVANAAEPDIVVADFEGADYGQWKVEGTAFGTGPAHGTLPNQWAVSGFIGKGLVNSYHGGDPSTGRLLSPPFVIQRKYIKFLIGGGMHPDMTCMNLLIGGEVVRTATGPNDRPGGTEQLDWSAWDVSDLAGQQAVIEIVDHATGSWGHINVDQIVQSDRPKAEPWKPVKLYDEKYRPQFHFTAAKNWLNDPNGMVFYDGEYHLFFQHNPGGIQSGNLSWGHAVSRDMLHWTQLSHAIRPDERGPIWSGSAVVDVGNTAGLQSGKEPPIVCFYTVAGGTSDISKDQPFTQSIAVSNDRGRTFEKYAKNPVLGQIVNGNRDPKVLWHAPSKQWVMALYIDGDRYALFGSPDLKKWTKLCDVVVPGSGECPDFFELPIDGNLSKTKWVFWGANGRYLLGSFDGKVFTPEAGPFDSHFGRNRYAAQTFSDIPKTDGRRIQIAWMQGGDYPGMPFNQQMSIPAVLTLKTFTDGVRLCTEPVKEVEDLREKHHAWSGKLAPGENPLAEISGELFDIRAVFEPGDAAAVGLKIRGAEIRYDAKEKKLSCMGASAPAELNGGRIGLRVLVDRSSIEIFTADGRVNMAFCFLPLSHERSIAAFAEGGAANVPALDVWELKSAWKK